MARFLSFLTMAVVLLSFSVNIWAQGEEPSSMSSSLPVHFHDKHEQEELVQILSDMGFTSLATRFMASDLLVGWRGPVTIFAPTEQAFQGTHGRHPFSPLELSHHIVRGLFTYSDLQTLPYDTKLRGIVSGHDLIVTSNGDGSDDRTVYVNGVMISHPDLLNDGLLVLHGIDAFLDTPSSDPPSPTPSAHHVDNNKTFTPAPSAATLILPSVLQNTTVILRDRGYSILALAMRIKAAELVRLETATIFAMDDDTIFMPGAGGQDYVNNVRYHVVPNKRLVESDLQTLPVGSRLETLLEGHVIDVTGGGRSALSVNYIPVQKADVFVNAWIAVHKIGQPLIRPPLHHVGFGGIGVN